MNEPLKRSRRLDAARDYPAAEAVRHAVVRDILRYYDALYLLGVLLTLHDQTADSQP